MNLTPTQAFAASLSLIAAVAFCIYTLFAIPMMDNYEKNGCVFKHCPIQETAK